jgi:hypothetical protein
MKKINKYIKNKKILLVNINKKIKSNNLWQSIKNIEQIKEKDLNHNNLLINLIMIINLFKFKLNSLTNGKCNKQLKKQKHSILLKKLLISLKKY